MKHSVVKIFLSVFFLFVLVTFGFSFFILRSPWFWEKAVTKLFNSQSKGAQLTLISTQSPQLQKFILRFKHLKFTIKQARDTYIVDIDTTDVDLRGIFSHKQMIVHVEGIHIHSSLVEASEGILDLTFHFKANNLETLNGYLHFFTVDVNKYVLMNMDADFLCDSKKIVFEHLASDFYQGKLKGKITLEYSPVVTYDMAINLDHVNLSSLKTANPDVFSKVRGRIDGTVEAKGDLKRVRFVEAKLNVPEDGQLKASLLKPLLQYIPQSTQKKDLELLLKLDGLVALERATIELKSISEDKLITIIDLGSKRFNLDSHLTVDLNVEGGLQNLSIYFEKVSK